MKVAHILPTANQAFYYSQEYVMILAHLVKKGLYSTKNFHGDQYIIMDNGLYEKAQVSTSLQDCIDIAERSGIPVKEIIIPDAINDLQETIKLFKENLETIKKYQDRYRFMFVAQATTYEELSEAIDFINSQDYNLSVGVSKLSPLNRADDRAVECYRKCKHPIHLLGIKESFDELLTLSNEVRGCDTSQVAFFAKNNISPVKDNFIYYHRDGKDIDLAKDRLDQSLVDSYLTITNHLLYLAGITDSIWN